MFPPLGIGESLDISRFCRLSIDSIFLFHSRGLSFCIHGKHRLMICQMFLYERCDRILPLLFHSRNSKASCQPSNKNSRASASSLNKTIPHSGQLNSGGFKRKSNFQSVYSTEFSFAQNLAPRSS